MKPSDLGVDPIAVLIGIAAGFVAMLLWPRNWKSPTRP